MKDFDLYLNLCSQNKRFVSNLFHDIDSSNIHSEYPEYSRKRQQNDLWKKDLCPFAFDVLDEGIFRRKIPLSMNLPLYSIQDTLNIISQKDFLHQFHHFNDEVGYIGFALGGCCRLSSDR